MPPLLPVFVLLLAVGLISLGGMLRPALRRRLVLEVEAIRENRDYGRLLTSCLVHDSVTHLLVNLGAILLFGHALAKVLGATPVVIVFACAAFGGAALTYWINRNKPYETLGASAATCGVVCAYLLVAQDASVTHCPRPFRRGPTPLAFLSSPISRMGGKRRTSPTARIWAAPSAAWRSPHFTNPFSRLRPHV